MPHLESVLEPHLARAMMLLARRDEEKALVEVAEAERLAALRPEYAPLLANARALRREIEEAEEEDEETEEMAQLLAALENMPRDMRMPADLRRRLAKLGVHI